MHLIDTSGVAMNVIGFILACIPFLCYHNIVTAQLLSFQRATSRIQTLSTRTALFLPAYTILILISLLYPSVFIALQVPIAVAEGYSFYCFFVLLVISSHESQTYLTADVEISR